MNVLEKVLQEIEEATFQEDAPIYIGDMEVDGYVRASRVEDIIRSHMDEGKDTNVPSNEGWIPVEERLPEANEIVMVTVHSSEWVSDFDTSFVPEEEKKFHPERYDVFVGCLRENREWIFFDESMSETSCEKEFGNDKGYIYSVVSAWCPFPEPYKPK